MVYNTTSHVGFVSEANSGRGTVGILWQCLTAIFLCICTVLHLDVPPRPMPRSRSLLRSTTWLLIGLLVPELMCLKAVYEFFAARKLVRVVIAQERQNISMKQAHFLLWGGLRIIHQGRILKNSQIGTRILDEDHFSNEASKFLKVLLKYLPDDEDIDDRSKADVIAKFLACGQAFWFAAQILGRLVLHLDISLLEVATSAYVVLALVAYWAWLRKPYNIQKSRHIPLPFHIDGDIYSSAEPTRDAGPTRDYNPPWFRFDFAFLHMDSAANGNGWKVPFLAMSFFLFGGIHAAAWKYSFPTRFEMWMWRGSALILIGAAGYFMIEYTLTHQQDFEDAIARRYLTSRSGPWYRIIHPWFPYIVLVAWYVAARLFILVEIFISLRSAPVGIYKDLDWSRYVGHFGS
jgi:hypothetical protein